MEALTLGPLTLPLSRIPGLIALVILLLGSELLNKRHPGMARWGWLTLIVATLGGRLAYAASIPSAYIAQPWTLLYFWQPGYSLWGAVLSGGIFTLVYWRKQPAKLIPSLTNYSIASILGLAFLLLTPGSQFNQEPLPQLSFMDINGQQQYLPDFKGQPLIINLWATWCPPCRREMPLLESYEQDPRLHTLMINQGENLVKVDEFLRSHQLSFTTLLIDTHQSASRTFRAQGLPATLFYNAEGLLVDRHFGELSRGQIESFLQKYASN